ncbi:pentapeptide repeat-containing protein, partial [Limnoraphis robusta Tam1]|uniref:pentapeptide repeat-containing protein n=1 Tax=Limnoraphis robusta TaxID=1118279 RepID=UPI002B2063F4
EIMLEGAGATVQPETVKLIVSTPVEKVVVYLEKPEVKPQIVAVPAVQLSEQSRIELVESSFEKIKPEANEFVASFYDNLFKENPETEPLFNKTDIKKQHQKLLNSLVLLVENIRQPDVLKPVLKDLGARHKGYGTLPEYYPAVGQALLTTFAQYLKEDWTAETEQAWVETYEVITQLMLEGATQVSAPAEMKQQTEPATEPAKKQSKSVLKGLNFTGGFNPKKRLSESYQSIHEKVKAFLNKLLNIFWELPTGVVAGGSALALIAFILLVEENEDSILAKMLGQVETISLLIALVLYIKEIPERRKESHYQAWSTIDAAKGVKVSYARMMALQDLNEDGIPLRGLDAVDADLTAINLPKADLSSSNLTKAILKEANLSRANFDKALLARADLSGANLSHANFSFAKLSYANLSLANLNHANLICADLRNGQMSGADLQGAQLSGANLDGAYLTGANLQGANVSEFDLRGAYLKGAIMPDGSKHP